MTRLSSCICPGYEAVFECIVTGSITTIWSGTAFDQCSSDTIVLRHNQFDQPEYSQNCGGSESIIGRAVSVVNNDSYTSQLVVNVSEGLNGTNVECSSSNGSHIMHNIGTKQILLTTGTYNYFII